MRGKVTTFRRGVVVLLAILVFPLCAQAKADEVTVMTWNLYVGFDILAAATAPEGEFLDAVEAALALAAASSFPERAEALAAEIVEKKPHLIGLQEVYNFTLNGENADPPYRDYLADLLVALQAQGVVYEPLAVVNNLDITLPLAAFGLGNIGILDRDVILVRGDVEIAYPLPFPETICRTSVDGCNYQVVASTTLPILGPINIERGYVAAYAEVDNYPLIFVNTHLEVKDLGTPVVPFGFFQGAQAAELNQVLDALKSTAINPLGAPVVVAGDFNSDPRDDYLAEFGPFAFSPPYRQLSSAGFLDAWLLHRPGNPTGFTCCQEENLLNRRSALDERVDLIFSSDLPRKLKVDVVGDKNSDKTPSGLWPSDHAGVAAELTFQ
jgi:endonuclease/exonuclease/phosphatase family metal-dependent hydrolase